MYHFLVTVPTENSLLEALNPASAKPSSTPKARC